MLATLVPRTDARFSVALLALRVVTGFAFLFHGMPKLAHPLGWDDGPTAPLPGIPAALQLVVALLETVGGGLAILGLLTSLVTFGWIVDMLVVIGLDKAAHGLPFVGAPSWEIEAHLLVAAFVLLVCGPGAYSVDALLEARARSGPALRRPWLRQR